MKTLIVIFLLLSSAFISQSPAESPELKEASDRTDAAIKLFKEQKFDEQGNVSSVRDVCQGPPDLTLATMKAVRKARFTPTVISGQPVKVTGFVQYNFVVQPMRQP